ncbi:MAG: Uma2 family endonuclease [Pirellulales bacterium]
MATATTGTAPFPSGSAGVPPLEMGDHLTRAEFERRYDAMPDLKKAELIEGVVYIPSRAAAHYGQARILLAGWVGNYLVQTPELEAADNTTIRFDDLNEPQPDVLLALQPVVGGRLHIDEDGYYAGSPEFIAEIAASSVSYDLHAKLRVYQREEVREYLVWRTRDGEIDWFRLDEGKYVPIVANEAGIVKSTVFPGLWLDRAALLRCDLMRVFAVLQEGLASPEHASFVQSLRQKRAN